MKKLVLIAALLVTGTFSYSQPEDPKQLYENAKTFMRAGDFDNAIIVLSRLVQNGNKDLDISKDLVMSYYMKRDYAKALDGAKELIDRDDVDVASFQIAGNVYKALEDAKGCDKLYKRAIKKFPTSGPLWSEYGEYLWATKDYTAIQKWEQGIKLDPAYSGNYYNAAMFYFYTKDKVWSLIYAEIFINMESMGERAAVMKQSLLTAYKEKLFADKDIMKGEENNKNEFVKAFLTGIGKQASLTQNGITTETLTMIRTRFILDWYNTNAVKFPYRLFDYQRQLLAEGMFNAYNEWLFGPIENLAAYENWTKTHAEEYKGFTAFQKTRVFRMPAGQYYQATDSKK